MGSGCIAYWKPMASKAMLLIPRPSRSLGVAGVQN